MLWVIRYLTMVSISDCMLIRRQDMETNWDVAGREQPAAGLSAGLYRGTDNV